MLMWTCTFSVDPLMVLTLLRCFVVIDWVRTDDSRLLQDSNLADRQPCRTPHHVIQSTTSEGLAQGP